MKNNKLTLNLALLSLSSLLSMLPAVADTDIVDNTNVDAEVLTNMDIDIDTSLTQALANNVIWHRLLLYSNSKNSHSKKSSRALDDDFFVSAHGKNDPHAELMAGLQSLNNATTAENYLCRFPARSHWLMSQIPTLQPHVQALIGTSHCQQVEDWLKTVDARQLSLIHAEEHVNRIGSSLGHTLIKIDTTTSLASHQSDDAYFMNFATDEAIAEQQGVKANLNALRGRGIGTMTFGQYTPKQANYLITDQRDIWQYQLDLPQATINQIMRHLWEIKSIRRHYNFLTYNCASEVLRLIDVALIEDGSATTNLMTEVGTIVAPAEVSRLLDKHGLLKKQQFTPALRTVKQATWNNQSNFSNLSHTPKQTTPQTANERANYEKQSEQGTLPHFIPSDNNPLNANKTHRVTLGIKHGEAQDNAIIGVRGAYQDLLDSPVGKRDFLNQTMMSLNLGYSEDEQKVQIEEATLLEILMLNPKNGTIPSASLGGHLKITPVIDASNHNNQEHRVASVGAEYGSSWLIGQGKKGTGEVPNTLCYALADAQGQVGKINKGYRVGLGAHTGCVHYINDKLRVMADARLPYWYQGSNHYFQPKVSLAGQYDFGNHKAVRASVAQQKNFDDTDTNYTLSYHWFFD